jgi:hypothetical protein
VKKMATGSGLLTASGVLAIVAGAAVALIGVVLIALLLFGRGVPISGAGFFAVATTIVGPLSVFLGAAVIVAGFKLMSGHGWARTFLVIFCWLVLLGTVFCLAYIGVTSSNIEGKDIVSGTIYFLLAGLPSIILLLLLRADAVKDAMTH